MLKVYQNENGKTLISKEVLNLDGWKELIAGSTDAAQEKHVPGVEKKCKTVKVDVGSVAHPMTEAHHIVWIEIVSGDWTLRKYLHPGEKPAAEFKLCCNKTEKVLVRAYCNMHGLWQIEV